MVTIPGVGPRGLKLVSRGGGPEPTGGRPQAFGDPRRATGSGFLPDDDDVATSGSNAQAGEFVIALVAGIEGIDVAVSAEFGVDRTMAGAPHDVIRAQVTGAGGAGRRRAAAGREAAPAATHTDVGVGLDQAVGLLARAVWVNRYAGAVALPGRGRASVGLRQPSGAVSADVAEPEVRRLGAALCGCVTRKTQARGQHDCAYINPASAM